MIYPNNNSMEKQEHHHKVGYAYVPIQKLHKVYSPAKALAQGTVFPELDIGTNEYERGLYNGK